EKIYQMLKLLQKNNSIEIILNNSRIQRERLKLNLKNESGIEAVSTVILVDAFYSKRLHSVIAHLIKNELNVNEVIGRYLFSVEEYSSAHQSLLDSRSIDPRMINMAVQNFYLIQPLFGMNGENEIQT